MGENICNEATDKELIPQIYKQLMKLNINKQSNQKIGGRPKLTFLQRRHTDGKKKKKNPQTHEKMFNILNY